MTEPKLKARLWVQAALRQCAALDLPAVVARRGDEDAGVVLVQLNRGADGSELFIQVRDADGRLGWMRATGPVPIPEDKAEAYIARQRDIDWDLWVIEVEMREGVPPFLTPQIGG